MLIEIYPKPDGMQHINLMFCEAEPDPEDGWVRSRIDAFPTPPKRIFEEERAGRTYTPLQYGQCVIGHSMFYIEKHKGVVDKLPGVRTSELERVDLAQPARNAIMPSILYRHQLIIGNTLSSVTWSAMLAIGAITGGLRGAPKARRRLVDGLRRNARQYNERKRIARGQEPTDPGSEDRIC